MVSPGLSSTPAKREPIMTTLAPAAMALVTSPEYLMPPSAMIGIPRGPAARKASEMAVIWGMPAPGTMRVVQMLPGPMPTLMASAPASMRAMAPSYVAMLPAIRQMWGKRFLTSETASRTREEWPWAESMARASTRAATSSAARSRKSPVAPMAPATRRRPWESFEALGYFSFFWMSLTVMRPLSS